MSRQGRQRIVQRHLRVGWLGLLIFVMMGAVLELLNGFKAGFYLDVSSESRRLLWTLAPAHGALLSLLQLGFAGTVLTLSTSTLRQSEWASRCLLASLILVPGGFFAGGAFIHGGDPGLGILLLPPGVLLLIAGISITLRNLWRADPSGSSESE